MSGPMMIKTLFVNFLPYKNKSYYKRHTKGNRTRSFERKWDPFFLRPELQSLTESVDPKMEND